jgi:hypothetical protein
MKFSVLLMLCLSFFACSRTLEKDYKVVDASMEEIPEWVIDLEEWLDDEVDDEEFEKNRFYIYTSEPKNDRDIACKLAHANSAASVAAEISTFIKESFAQSKSGDPSKTDSKLSEYLQNDLYKEVQATITGIQQYRKYWEKRRYKQDMGAKKDWDGYVCTSLVKIPKKQLQKSFERVEKSLETKVNNQAKQQVYKLLKETKDKYLNDADSGSDE